MPELRWILIFCGVALLVGIYMWGRRSGESAPDAEDAFVRLRPEPELEEAQTYETFEEPIDRHVIDDEPAELQVADAPLAVEPAASPLPQRIHTPARAHASDEPREPTLEPAVNRERPRSERYARIEPTFGEDRETAELPARDLEALQAPSTPPSQAVAADGPTLSLSNTPPPRRIERRKIIALRLASPQRLPGAQLQVAFETESLVHGKYDVFHRLDEHGVAIFSVASMVEPGTFDVEKMPHEHYSGITLFAQLPGPVAGLDAFNELLACSRRLHTTLGGTLQDDRGVPLTIHRVERLKQDVRDFENRASHDANRSSPTFSSTL